MTLVFDLINELQLMGEAANTPFTKVQLVSFAVRILQATGDFQDGIKVWNRRPAAACTWTDFITHFEQEYAELLKLCGPTMQNSNLHSTNAILDKVLTRVDGSLDAVIKRYVANAVFYPPSTTNNSLPPEL